MNILIYDGVCPEPYTTESVKSKPVGGTEATVLRVAEGFLSRGHGVVLAQRNREVAETFGGELLYTTLAFTPLPETSPQVVITLRDAGHYVANQKRFPKAKHYLWLHDVVSGEYRDHLLHHLNLSAESKVHVVCVSDFHKTNVIDNLREIAARGNLRVTRIYNPIAPYVVKDPNVMIDHNKLVFFSSPHKGLKETAHMFQMIRRIDPEMRLYVANPGYFPDATDFPEGMVNVGVLPHKQVLEHVRNALCVFYPNYVFAETFGLVMAEANAVGTPVLTHPLGAANEVLEHPHQFLDCRNYKDVVDRVLHWKNGNRPVVSGRPEFKLDNVLKDWVRLFDRT